MDHVCSDVFISEEVLNASPIQTDVQCGVCGKKCAHSSSLDFHMQKRHKQTLKQQLQIEEHSDYSVSRLLRTRVVSKQERLETNCHCNFFCPVQGCKRHRQPATEASSSENKVSTAGAGLPSFHSLKVHYWRTHAQKSFVCANCPARFGTNSDRNKHQNM